MKQLVARFGLEIALTDISCRIKNTMAKLSAHLVSVGEAALPPLLQSLFHGLFHEWMCLVVRGSPWNTQLGRTTGEESERFFSIFGKLDNAMSQSSRLRRGYLLHSFVTYYNTSREGAMHTFLQRRFDRVTMEFKVHLEELQGAGGVMTAQQYQLDICELQVIN